MPELEVAVTPRAGTDRVGPYREGVLRVRVTRPPADGEANRAVLRLVAGALGLAPGRLAIRSGEHARRKRISVEGLASDELERRLRAIGVD